MSACSRRACPQECTAGTDHHHWQLPCGPESGHPVPDADRCTCRESRGSRKPLTNLPRRIRGLVIQAEDIQLGLPSVDKENRDPRRRCAACQTRLCRCRLRRCNGRARKSLVTTYMGMGVAIPHGTSEKKSTVKKSGVVMLQYPDGVDFGDEKSIPHFRHCRCR